MPDERILTQFHHQGDSAQAKVVDASCSLGSYHGECVIGEPGVHTVDVYLYSGTGEASYAIGVESRDQPASCTTLDPATFSITGPLRDGTLPRGSAGDCYRFAGTPGMRLAVEATGAPATEGGAADVRGWIQNPAGESICPIQFGSGTCSVTEDGPHTLFLADQYGGAVTYRLRLVRADAPIGCPALRPAGFGELADDQVGSGEVEAGGFDCYTVTAPAGLTRVRTSDGGQLNWELSNAGGTVCSEWDGPCDLAAAGTYTLWIRNTDWETRSYRATLINLATDRGCAPATGTGWDQPTITVLPSSPLQALCQPFTAETGERIIAYSTGGHSWITDATGADICADQAYDELDGCALPGTGPYRVVTLPEREVRQQIRRLSAPSGCQVVTPGTYGTAPAGALSANRCRLLDVPTAGRHLIRAVDDENYETYAQIYDADAKKVCSGGLCDFPAAGRYPMIIGGSTGVEESAYATVFAAPGAAGCTRAGDQGIANGAVSGSFTVAGETDCLELTATAGTPIGVLLPPRATGAARPEWTLVNGAGENLCENGCTLDGPAPYRLLLNAPDDSTAGDYAVVVQRSDRMDGCPVLPQGKIGATVGVTTAFSASRFATCYSIPAGQHATSEIIGFAPVTGHDGWAAAVVRDSAGKQVCGSARYASAQLYRCALEAGKAYTLVLSASATDFQYRLHREDASPAGATCRTPSNTVLGGPALAGALRTDDEVHCYRVTGAAADSYWLGVRSTKYAARYWITDASGAQRCTGYVVPCRVSGSTSYQIFVWPGVDGQTVPYRLDTWKLTSGGQPVAQCPPVAAAPGFGAITGTLNDQKTAVCVAVPVSRYSDFYVEVSNTAGGTATPEPYYFTTVGAEAGLTACSWSSAGGQHCQVRMPDDKPSGMALFVIAPETENGNLPFRAVPRCDDICAPDLALGGVSPAAVPNSGLTTLTLRGSGFTGTETVTLTRAGAPTIPATVRGVTGGTALTVSADLTGITPGGWNIVVRPATGITATLTGALTVTAAPLKPTRAPSVSGTVRVGGTVRAAVGAWTPTPTAYAYQWTVNGSAIKGATGVTYAVPASLRGTRLAVIVTAWRPGRAATRAASAAVTVGYGVAPKATVKPRITGTVKAGRTVKAAVGTWSPQATSYRYEWRVNGKVVARTSALKLQTAWAGKNLTLLVVARRPGHSDGLAVTAAVKVKR